jgi:putative acetyltransferase
MPTNMTLEVRRARVEDRGPLLELWERSVRATHDFLTEADIVALRPLVAQALAGQDVEWWVAVVEGGALAGFLGYTPDTIEGLFVDPDRRGAGTGTRLVRHAESLARGPLAVDVNEQNDAALGFYRALGFELAGRSPTDSGGRPFPLLHLKRPARHP